MVAKRYFYSSTISNFMSKSVDEIVGILTQSDTYDINKDGIEDLVLGGNYHNREVETSRSDASVGQFLLNNGQGNFAAIYNSISGLKLSNDLRELRIVKNSNNASVLIAANNNAPLQAFLLK